MSDGSTREYAESIARTLERNAPLVVGAIVQGDMRAAASLLLEQYDEIERLRGRLRDVVTEVDNQMHYRPGEAIAEVVLNGQRIIAQAGYVRCERCCGTGGVSVPSDGAIQGYVTKNCDCIHGWRLGDGRS